MNVLVWALVKSLVPLVILILVLIAIPCIFILLMRDRDSDRFQHPEEYATKGAEGERLLYLRLKELGVPEKQILRNVYIPTRNGTTEIDLLVVSRKGLLVFECKNYHGNVYGDGNKVKWVQYLGKKKSYFLSPVIQNRGHVKRLREYFSMMPSFPIIPFVATVQYGNKAWKLKNIKPEDHVIRMKDFMEIYNNLPESEFMNQNINIVYSKLKPLERPDDSVRQAHIEQIKNRKY